MPAPQRRPSPRTGAATPTRLLARLCALVVLATACGRPVNTDPATHGGSERPTYTALQIANYAVESAYEQFWTVLELLDQDPPERWPGELAAVATEPELSRQLHAATTRHNTHVQRYAVPTRHVRAILGAFGTIARIEDCQVAANGRHIPVSGTLTRPAPDSEWLIQEINYLPGTC